MYLQTSEATTFTCGIIQKMLQIKITQELMSNWKSIPQKQGFSKSSKKGLDKHFQRLL